MKMKILLYEILLFKISKSIIFLFNNSVFIINISNSKKTNFKDICTTLKIDIRYKYIYKIDIIIIYTLIYFQ